MVASIQPIADWRRTPAGRRAISFALAVGVHLLLLLLLLRLAPDITKRPPPGGPTTIYTVPAAAPERQAAKQASRQPQKRATTTRAARTAQPRPTQHPVPAQTSAQPWVLNPEIAGFNLTPSTPHTQVAATDAGDGAAAGSGAEGGGGNTAGRGSGGQLLYRAEWVREPTDAEMSPYMPHGNFVGGWADIACRTVPRFHVEDCEELGQSPPGSGLSRALREAAWQFLVRPPRLNGKTQVGEWVRIHFDFVERRKE